MIYYTIPPPAKLASYVQFFWVLEGSATAERPLIHRALADISPEWIFYCKGRFSMNGCNPEPQQTFPSGIYGQMQTFKTFCTSDDFSLFGVYLFPYVIPELFGLPASALSDQAVDTGTLLGYEGQLLEERIFEASDHRHRVKLISQFIQQRLAKSRQTASPVFSSIRKILLSSATLSVRTLAEDCFLSRRQFERTFLHYAGYSPKQFQKIARFNAVIKGFENTPTTLTEMAYEYGYYDQSHFIHDFQLLSGYNPKHFFKHQTDGVNYRASKEFNP